MDPQYDFLFKVVVVGDIAVGKTCLLLRFADDTFNENHRMTIGVDFKIRTIELRGRTVKLQIWDTMGHERFRTMTSTYYRGANGVVIVYDITDQESFNSVGDYIREAQHNDCGDASMLIVGNKCDLVTKRAVEQETAEEYARRLSIPFIETSAKEALNVDEAFTIMASEMIKNSSHCSIIPGNADDDIVKLNSKPQSSYLGWCC